MKTVYVLGVKTVLLLKVFTLSIDVAGIMAMVTLCVGIVPIVHQEHMKVCLVRVMLPHSAHSAAIAV